MNWTGIAQIAVTFLTSMAGAGPWGVAALGVGILALVGGVAFLIAKWNGRVDSQDLDRGGADAGQSAVDLKNQADRNRDFERQTREEIEKEGPPKEPPTNGTKLDSNRP